MTEAMTVIENLDIADRLYWGFWPTPGIAADVWDERKRQITKWGLQERPSGTDANAWLGLELQAKEDYDKKLAAGELTWVDILAEEVYETFAEEDPEKLRVELVQVMAVAASWIQDLDRRGDL